MRSVLYAPRISPAAVTAASLALLALPAATVHAQTADPPTPPAQEQAQTPPPAAAEEPQKPASGGGDLAEMNLEELMGLKVTTASRREESLSGVASAIYVITQEEIRRSGASSIPELLRFVPGLNVAQIDANKWAISARGWNYRFGYKLLVLVDGRTVYAPTFGGVLWSTQDYLLEDVERIEVIRGPGGALWGADAVNGVINIITKNAKDTTGWLQSTQVGDVVPVSAALRQGTPVGKNGAIRAYAKTSRTTDFLTPADAGGSAGATRDLILNATSFDGWAMTRGGFRYDAGERTAPGGAWMVQGEGYSGKVRSRAVSPLLEAPYVQLRQEKNRLEGFHFIGQWERQTANGASTRVQAFFDRYDNSQPEYDERRDTYDLDLLHQFPRWGAHSLVVGAAARISPDKTTGTEFFRFDPADYSDDVYSVFLNDEVALRPDLRMSLGARLDHNVFSGWEFQPNVRFSLTPDPRHTLWAAASRAVNKPTPFYRSGEATIQAVASAQGPPALIRFTGNDNFDAEVVEAYELGYRFSAGDRVTVDAAAFYNVYPNALTSSLRGDPVFDTSVDPPVPVFLISGINGLRGQTWGLEMSGRVQVTKHWRLLPGVTLYDEKYETIEGANAAPKSNNYVGTRQQYSLRSFLDLAPGLQLDGAIYHVAGIMDGGVTPDYTRVDVRLGYRPRNDLDVSLGFQNLTDASHREVRTANLQVPSDIPRSFYTRVTYRWK